MTQGVSLGSAQRAVAAACNALTNDVCVVKHHPEQYFITFIHQHHCAIALGCGPIRVDHYFLHTSGKRAYDPGSFGPLILVAEPGSITRDQCRSRFQHELGPIGLHVDALRREGAWVIGPSS
jgi:hypothetical protein